MAIFFGWLFSYVFLCLPLCFLLSAMAKCLFPSLAVEAVPMFPVFSPILRMLDCLNLSIARTYSTEPKPCQDPRLVVVVLVSLSVQAAEPPRRTIDLGIHFTQLQCIKLPARERQAELRSCSDCLYLVLAFCDLLADRRPVQAS